MDITPVNRPFRDHEFIAFKANGFISQDDGVAAVDIEAGDVVYLRDAADGVTGGYAHYVTGLSAAKKATVGIAFATVKAGEGVSVVARHAEFASGRVTFPAGAAGTEAQVELAKKHVFPL